MHGKRQRACGGVDVKIGDPHGDGPRQPARRRFVQGLAAGGVVAGFGGWQRFAHAAMPVGGMPTLSGTDFTLSIGETLVNYTGATRPAVTVNGSLPAPLLRWKQGTTV